MTLVNTGSVWQLCLLWFDVCVDHSTWPVWRHQGHRQISFPLMSACRRIQQVNKSSGAVSFYLPPFPLSLSLRLSLSVFVPPPSASLNLSNLLFAVWKSPLYLSSRSSFVREWISLYVFSESQLIPPSRSEAVYTYFVLLVVSYDFICAEYLTPSCVAGWYLDPLLFALVNCIIRYARWAVASISLENLAAVTRVSSFSTHCDNISNYRGYLGSGVWLKI